MVYTEEEFCIFCPYKNQTEKLQVHLYRYHHHLCFHCHWCKKNRGVIENDVFVRYEVNKTDTYDSSLKTWLDNLFISKQYSNFYLCNMNIGFAPSSNSTSWK